MANEAKIAALEPTFNLPTGSASDFYLSREVNDGGSENNGKIIKKKGLWKYPFMTRRTNDSLVGTNEVIQSNEMRHGKTAGKDKIGTASSSGSHEFEFSPETFDDQLEGTFESEWVRWTHDGAKNLVTKDFLTKKGFVHVTGENGTYNQIADGKEVTAVPLFYTEDEKGTADDPYGLIKISAKNMGARTRAEATNPLGKFVIHELHIGEQPVKYSFISRIPINGDTVRYQNFKHVQVGQMSLNVTVNSIVTGSFNLTGANNPAYFTQVAETGKTRMATDMEKNKDVALGNTKDFYSDNFADGAEKFLNAVKNTTKSTDTDLFTALEGFLFVNGHQLQFASDLSMDMNKNIQPVYAIFVKNAIANIEPKLDVTGSVTVYFTDGEVDSTGKKFGADDLKNLASENKDVEILYAFQDKEDPECLYLFQIFKSTFESPQENKSADSAITLALNYKSYGEMAVRCLRMAIPKISRIEFDTADAFSKIEDDNKKIKVVLYPNVPLDSIKESAYVDPESDLYVFKDANVSVDTVEDTGATFSDVEINEDGSISATLELSEVIVQGTNISLKILVNGQTREASCSIEPEIDYLRMGEKYQIANYKENGAIVLSEGATLDIMSAKTTGDEDEDYLFFWYNRAAMNIKTSDLVFKSSDKAVATVDTEGVITAVDNGTAKITVSSKIDEDIKFSFDVKVGDPVLQSISVITSGGKTEFAVGDSFDNEGIVVMATYDVGSEVDVTADAVFDSSEFNGSEAGSYTIGVTYGGKTADYTVTVAE